LTFASSSSENKETNEDWSTLLRSRPSEPKSSARRGRSTTKKLSTRTKSRYRTPCESSKNREGSRRSHQAKHKSTTVTSSESTSSDDEHDTKTTAVSKPKHFSISSNRRSLMQRLRLKRYKPNSRIVYDIIVGTKAPNWSTFETRWIRMWPMSWEIMERKWSNYFSDWRRCWRCASEKRLSPTNTALKYETDKNRIVKPYIICIRKYEA